MVEAWESLQPLFVSSVDSGEQKNADSALESGFFPPESRWDMPIEGVLRLTF